MGTNRASCVRGFRAAAGFVVLLVVAAAVLAVSAPPAEAADGTILRTFTAEAEDCGVGTGLAFNGRELILSCNDHGMLDYVSPLDGHRLRQATVNGMSSIGAMAWDRGRNTLWACGGFSGGDSSLYQIDPTTSTATFRFSVRGCVDGLAYDGSDDTIWASGDVDSAVGHYRADTGEEIATIDVSGKLGECGNSGLAVGGQFLMLANNGCSQIFKSTKDLDEPAIFGSYPARLEDMECDDVSFAATGQAAIWTKDAYDTVLNAFELNPGDCGYGGFGSALTLTPSQQSRVSEDNQFQSFRAQLRHPETFEPMDGVVLHPEVTSGPSTGADFTCSHPGPPPTPQLPFPQPVIDPFCRTDAAGQLTLTYRTGLAPLGEDRVLVSTGALTGDDLCPGFTFSCTFRGGSSVKWLEPINFLSFGDSYSAGEGQRPYSFPAPGQRYPNRCHRSVKGYPAKVQPPNYQEPIHELDQTDDVKVEFHFLACSGAVTSNVLHGGEIQNYHGGPDNWFDEPATQLDQGPPNSPNDVDLVTMSIGGNDVGFSKIVTACATDWIPPIFPPDFSEGSCLDPENKVIDGQALKDWLPKKIDSMFSNPDGTDGPVTRTYQEIRTQYPSATIVIVGYPHLFPDTEAEQACGKLFPWKDEMPYLNEMSDRFDGVLRQAADKIGVHYLPVTAKFAHHGVCGDDGEWINHATEGPAVYTPVGDGSFHPTEEGYTAYAEVINDYLERVARSGWPINENGLPENPEPGEGQPGGGGGGDEDEGGGGGAARVAAATSDAAPGEARSDGQFSDLYITPPGGFSVQCPSEARSYRPTQTLDLVAPGFAPGSVAAIRFKSNAGRDPIEIGTATVGADGYATAIVQVPDQPFPDMLARFEIRGSDPQGRDRVALEGFGVSQLAPVCPGADTTAPTVTLTTPSNGATYTQGQAVTTAYSCADNAGGSGVATCAGPAPSGTALDTTTAGSKTFTVTATDLAGNIATATATYNVVDATAPTATLTTPANGATYTRGQLVNAAYSCADNPGGTGVATCSGPVASGSPIDTSTVGAKTFTVTTSDRAGNISAATVSYTVAGDVTPPTVMITAPSSSATYMLGQVVKAAYSCVDNPGGTGVATCAGPVPSGSPIDTATVGTKTFTVTTKDRVGNATSKSVSYVVTYQFDGFRPPVDNLPKTNDVTPGRTIPIKFGLADKKGHAITDLSAIVRIESVRINCSTGATIGSPLAISGVRSRGGQYEVNWTTDRAWSGTCRRLSVNLKDGTSHYATFRFGPCGWFF